MARQKEISVDRLRHVETDGDIYRKQAGIYTGTYGNMFVCRCLCFCLESNCYSWRRIYFFRLLLASNRWRSACCPKRSRRRHCCESSSPLSEINNCRSIHHFRLTRCCLFNWRNTDCSSIQLKSMPSWIRSCVLVVKLRCCLLIEVMSRRQHARIDF